VFFEGIACGAREVDVGPSTLFARGSGATTQNTASAPVNARFTTSASKELSLPERITPLVKIYRHEELARFFAVCSDAERALFATFLLTGFREQEVMFLRWSDVNFELRTVRVTSKPELGFYPKRWEDREIRPRWSSSTSFASIRIARTANLCSHRLPETANSICSGHADMWTAYNQGLDTAETRTPESTTPTSFRQWCEEVLKPRLQEAAPAGLQRRQAS
jgi:integrase